ncbi:MAG: NUDIX domain-containing protein [Nanoarchaeota archaeon]|nr:NUDIX domain-containing protein [Nanoarchaeota archaeon]
MVKTSSGLLMYRFKNNIFELFLTHPGGPFWKNKDSWGIPKGEQDDINEDLFEVAKREFYEETGIKPPEDKDSYTELGNIKQKSGKIVHAWAFLNNNPINFKCNSLVKLEYPSKSNNFIEFPEVDKGEFFNIEKSKNKMIDFHQSQYELIERLIKMLNIKIEAKVSQKTLNF